MVVFVAIDIFEIGSGRALGGGDGIGSLTINGLKLISRAIWRLCLNFLPGIGFKVFDIESIKSEGESNKFGRS